MIQNNISKREHSSSAKKYVGKARIKWKYRSFNFQFPVRDPMCAKWWDERFSEDARWYAVRPGRLKGALNGIAILATFHARSRHWHRSENILSRSPNESWQNLQPDESSSADISSSAGCIGSNYAARWHYSGVLSSEPITANANGCGYNLCDITHMLLWVHKIGIVWCSTKNLMFLVVVDRWKGQKNAKPGFVPPLDDAFPD